MAGVALLWPGKVPIWPGGVPICRDQRITDIRPLPKIFSIPKPAQFSFENHRVFQVPETPGIPDISGIPKISGTQTSLGVSSIRLKVIFTTED